MHPAYDSRKSQTKAIRVEPKKPGTARMEDVSEPDTVHREAHKLRRCIPGTAATPLCRKSYGIIDEELRIIKNQNGWRLFCSELVGTALLVLGGLSLVIPMFGTGSPICVVVPSEWLRRMITGFLFGTLGASIALSPVGKESGAHINPVVTLGFWLTGKLDLRVALVYIFAQVAGASLGALPLLGRGSMGRSVAFGATLPGLEYR